MVGNGWRLSRGRGSGAAQLPLAVCAVIAIIVVLLGKAEASIFDRARAKLSDFMAPVLEQVREPLSGLERWIDGLGTFFSVYQENIRLKQENAELRHWQNVALSLERRVGRYELLLHAVADSELPSISARVIGQSSHPFVKTMILNAGNAEGVKSGQAVVDDRGLLGRIYLSGERSSWVILLTDLNSRIPVIDRAFQSPRHHGGRQHAGARAADQRVGREGQSRRPGGVFRRRRFAAARSSDWRRGRAWRRSARSVVRDADAADFVHVLDYQAPAEPPPARRRRRIAGEDANVALKCDWRWAAGSDNRARCVERPRAQPTPVAAPRTRAGRCAKATGCARAER